jgi:hypothetical protein
MNPLTYNSSSSECLTVDYFDINGTNCVKCTQSIYSNEWPNKLNA